MRGSISVSQNSSLFQLSFSSTTRESARQSRFGAYSRTGNLFRHIWFHTPFLPSLLRQKERREDMSVSHYSMGGMMGHLTTGKILHGKQLH